MAAADESDFDEAETPPSQGPGSSSPSVSGEEEEQDDQDDAERAELDDEEIPQAPSFKIPSRTISAVEHPCIIKNLDKGLETFGPNPQFQSVRESHTSLLSACLPMMLSPLAGPRSRKSSALCAIVSSSSRPCFTPNDVSLLLFSQRRLQDHCSQENGSKEEERKRCALAEQWC